MVSKSQLGEDRKTMTVDEIAKKYNKGTATIGRWLRKYGLTNQIARTDIKDEDVIQDFKSGLGINDIAKKYNTSHETILKRLKKYNLSHSIKDGVRKKNLDRYINNSDRIIDSHHGGIQKPRMTGSSYSFSKIMKYYQFGEFYKRELELWKDRDIQRKLYENRFKYIGKKPQELSDFELMRGMGISGIIRSYTVFNVDLLDKLVKKYNIYSIYDPCAGWGERGLYCYYNNIEYLGIDINKNLFKGYNEMIEDYNMQRVGYLNDDSSTVDVVGYKAQMVFTCPPYYDTEIYTKVGAENSENLKEFLDWWRKVVRNSKQVDPIFFAFQINQAYKDEMGMVVLEEGFEFVEEITEKNIQKSHLNQTKKEYESIMLFVNKERL